MVASVVRWLYVSLVVCAVPAYAQEPDKAAVTPQVQITGNSSDVTARRDFVAGKIIIGRKRIEESGAETVGDLLKREPSVSIDGEGRIGLMGLPGYTQILVDGEQPVSGKGPHELNLVHIEKIEIVKSSVAEYGPFGIAGTINILTRKSKRKTSTQLGVSAQSIAGRSSASATLSHNQSSAGSPLRLSANFSAKSSNPASARRTRVTSQGSSQPTREMWRSTFASQGRRTDVDASGEATWDYGNGSTVRLSPNGGRYTTDESALEERSYANGSDFLIRIANRSTFSMGSLPMSWTFKPTAKSQLEWKARLSRIGMNVSELRYETIDGQAGVRDLSQEATSQVKSMEVTYKAKVGKAHDVKLGANTMRTSETIDYRSFVDGKQDRTLDSLGQQRHAITRQFRLYAQDDWRVSESLAINAGLSSQETIIGLAEGTFTGDSRFQLWSPSFHLVKSLDDDDKRQLRLSLARTYRLPGKDELALRPRINSLAPCGAVACGANTIDTFDSAGNEHLRAERSLGMNLAYEHGIGGDSTLTAEVYTRWIGDKIGTHISAEEVSWSSTPRYVARPVNLGDAWVRGLNLEMELALRDLSKSAPRLNLRGSLNFAASRVSNLPGPDNKLEKQTPWSAKLGGTYALQGLPVKFQLDAIWAPGVWIRTGQAQRIAIARRFEIESSLAWAISPARRLQLSVADLTPRTARTIYEYNTAEGLVLSETNTRRYRTVALRFDTNL